MRHALWTLTIVSALAACGNGNGPTQPSGQASMTWRVERSSSGGITGMGSGNVAVTSDGTLSIFPPGRRGQGDGQGGQQTPTCTLKLTPEQLARIARAVEAADTGAWRGKGGISVRCCDIITYTLTVERRQRDARGAETGQSGAVSWFGDGEQHPPADAEAINQALDGLVPEGGCPM